MLYSYDQCNEIIKINNLRFSSSIYFVFVFVSISIFISHHLGNWSSGIFRYFLLNFICFFVCVAFFFLSFVHGNTHYVHLNACIYTNTVMCASHIQIYNLYIARRKQSNDFNSMLSFCGAQYRYLVPLNVAIKRDMFIGNGTTQNRTFAWHKCQIREFCVRVFPPKIHRTHSKSTNFMFIFLLFLCHIDLSWSVAPYITRISGSGKV